MAAKKMKFEEAIARLDEIVRQLERGDAPLDTSLSLFTEGSELIKLCGKMLDDAEQKVVKLRKGTDGTPEECEFEAEND